VEVAAIRKFVGDFPMHIWSAPKLLSIEVKLDDDKHFDVAGPMIILQRTPIAAITNVPSEIFQEQIGEKAEFTSEDGRDAREVAARRALQIDQELGEAYASLAHVRLHDWDWVGLEEDFKRSLEQL
jgi:hypothetical protein